LFSLSETSVINGLRRPPVIGANFVAKGESRA
jgi:hypothetical protein